MKMYKVYPGLMEFDEYDVVVNGEDYVVYLQPIPRSISIERREDKKSNNHVWVITREDAIRKIKVHLMDSHCNMVARAKGAEDKLFQFVKKYPEVK